MEAGDRRGLVLMNSLSDGEYHDTVVNSFVNRSPEVQRRLVKRLQKRGRGNAQKVGGFGVSGECNPPECPKQQPSKAAAKSPFIYQGHLIPEDDILFFDVEKLTIKAPPGGKHSNRGSSIAVVNRDKELVMWSFIKCDEDQICQLHPSITGITLEKLRIGQPLEIVQHFASLCFSKNMLVGYDMKDDLKCIGVDVEKTCDLSNYFVDNNGQKYSLKDLCRHFLEDEGFQCGIHSAIQDARRTRALYFKKIELEKDFPDFKTYPNQIQRSPKSAYVFDPKDICRCESAKKRKGKGKSGKGNKYYLPE